MEPITRRQALVSSGLATMAATVPIHLSATGQAVGESSSGDVKLSGDGLSLEPAELGRLLQELTAGGAMEADYYSNGGAVAAMETAFAAELGKERAVFFPTGTLANHVAIRVLAGSDTRVLLQEQSHVYNDSGDCVQVLSHLNLVPLGKGKATFTVEEVEAELASAARGRVRTGVGVISIESPVRRKLGEVFDLEEMKKISAMARGKGIRLHLDGARIYMASAYSGVPVREYASLFDTVYISLWKYFNAPFGAVLAGPAHLLDDIFHVRRMFGGGLPYAWPAAVVASHFLPGFPDRFRLATQRFERFLATLEGTTRLRVERIPGGTNYVKLKWEGDPEPEELRERLAARGVQLSPPSPFFRGFFLAANETQARMAPEDLAARFRGATAR